ncbi:acyl-CoA thioesterase [Marinicella sp. W31]|uniref:acyl-CoA thioesterase n=1 Tax=Marinicella sp. W31 TaxID=3023713 RepID=UPI00375833F7
MHIDELFAELADRIEDHRMTMQVPIDWSQGRTVYGGLTASLLYKAMRQGVDQERKPRYLNCSFISPLMAEEVFEIEVTPLRSGRSATQLMGKITQNGHVCVVAQVCFGLDRESKIQINHDTCHEMQRPKKGNFIPQIPKVVPKFLRHYDLSLVEGRFPFMAGKKDYMHGWVRFKKTPEHISEGHVVSLIDAWPCPVLQKLKWPAPASTMNWNIEFIHPYEEIGVSDWLAYQSQTRQAADGYCHMESNIWNQQGQLIAISRQVVAVFA